MERVLWQMLALSDIHDWSQCPDAKQARLVELSRSKPEIRSG